MEIVTIEDFLAFNETLEMIEGRLTDILRYNTYSCNRDIDKWEYIPDSKTICIYYGDWCGSEYEDDALSIPVEYILMTEEQWQKDMKEKREEEERIRREEQKRLDEIERRKREYEERKEYARLKEKYGE